MNDSLFSCHRKVLPICRDGKTAIEIATGLGLTLGTVYNYLHHLQASGHIKKISRTPKAIGALFVTISEEVKEIEKPAEPPVAMVGSEETRGVNQEFVKRSHNIWRGTSYQPDGP